MSATPIFESDCEPLCCDRCGFCYDPAWREPGDRCGDLSWLLDQRPIQMPIGLEATRKKQCPGLVWPGRAVVIAEVPR